MRRYKGKHNDELFSLIDDIDESLGENNSFNSYHNPSALTPEEVLAQNAASEADNEPTGALEALKKRMPSSQQQDTPEKAPQKTPEAPKVPEAPKTEAAPIHFLILIFSTLLPQTVKMPKADRNPKKRKNHCLKSADPL